jgi:hypothetical protein
VRCRFFELVRTCRALSRRRAPLGSNDGFPLLGAAGSAAREPLLHTEVDEQVACPFLAQPQPLGIPRGARRRGLEAAKTFTEKGNSRSLDGNILPRYDEFDIHFAYMHVFFYSTVLK